MYTGIDVNYPSTFATLRRLGSRAAGERGRRPNRSAEPGDAGGRVGVAFVGVCSAVVSSRRCACARMTDDTAVGRRRSLGSRAAGERGRRPNRSAQPGDAGGRVGDGSSGYARPSCLVAPGFPR